MRHEPTKKCGRFRGSATAFVHDVSPRSAWRPQYLDGAPQSKVKQQRGSLPEFLKSGPGVFPAISEGKGNRAPGHLMSKGSRVASATRNDLTVTVAVLKVACEQWWSGEAIT